MSRMDKINRTNYTGDEMEIKKEVGSFVRFVVDEDESNDVITELIETIDCFIDPVTRIVENAVHNNSKLKLTPYETIQFEKVMDISHVLYETRKMILKILDVDGEDLDIPNSNEYSIIEDKNDIMKLIEVSIDIDESEEHENKKEESEEEGSTESREEDSEGAACG